MEIVRNTLPSGLDGTQRVPFETPGEMPNLPASMTRNLAALEVPDVRTRILVYDVDTGARGFTTESFAGGPYDLTQCRNSSEVSLHLTPGPSGEVRFDLLLWGLTAPFEGGLLALKELRQAHPNLKITLMASQEALAYAPLIKSANLDALILKPLHAQDLRASVERVLRKPRPFVPNPPPAALTATAPLEALKTEALPAEVSEVSHEPVKEEPSVSEENETGAGLGLIGSSPEMLRIFSLVRKVGPTCVNIMITGESGSGKEMIAHAIHKVSDRSKKPFVKINCAAIPRELLESELFGHAKGAFPGAINARRGLFEEAHEGTILLDEIGDLPLPLQAKILRLIQTRQVKPLGQNMAREIDVRIISATHKNLKTLIQKGEFREDLYYRLNVMPIHLPALRERKDDILLLAEHFLRRCAERLGRAGAIPELSKKASQKLLGLSWKGNVRELENVIERSIVLSDGSTINENDVSSEEAEAASASAEDLFNSGLSLKDIEREYIKYVLGRTGNRKEAATKILGIDRKTLYRKEKLYGIRSHSDMN